MPHSRTLVRFSSRIRTSTTTSPRALSLASMMRSAIAIWSTLPRTVMAPRLGLPAAVVILASVLMRLTVSLISAFWT